MGVSGACALFSCSLILCTSMLLICVFFAVVSAWWGSNEFKLGFLTKPFAPEEILPSSVFGSCLQNVTYRLSNESER